MVLLLDSETVRREGRSAELKLSHVHRRLRGQAKEGVRRTKAADFFRTLLASQRGDQVLGVREGP